MTLPTKPEVDIADQLEAYIGLTGFHHLPHVVLLDALMEIRQLRERLVEAGTSWLPEAPAAEVHDITPMQDPIGLARDMEVRAQDKDFVAGFYLLMTEDGKLYYDGCSERRADLLWALERMKAEILAD